MSSLLFNQVHKIAILRASALGDFIVILPALQTIRAAYPKAELVLLGKAWHAAFLEEKRSPIDRVVVVPPMEGIYTEDGTLADARTVNEFFYEMQDEQFDIAIHFHGKGIAANPFIKRLGARWTVGLACPEAEPLDRAVPYYYYQSEVVRYLEVATSIGGEIQALEPEIKVTPQDLAEAEEFLRCHSIKNEYVVLHSCAVDLRRMWPIENFTALGDKLAEKGYQVIFSGSKDDDQKVRELIAHMAFPAINACGKLSLGGLSGLLVQSALVVSSDTGPLHLARAVGAKTVGIYWAPNLINWGPLSRTKHRPVISWHMQCPLCGIVPNDPYPFEPITAACDHFISFVKDIKVEQVLQEAIHLLHERDEGKDRKEEDYSVNEL